MAIRDLKAVIYHDDTGTQWLTAMDSTVFAQHGGDPDVRFVGGEDYAATPELPRRDRAIIPRHVRVAAGTDVRTVVCLDATAPLFVGTQTTIDLPVLGAAPVTYTVFKKVREVDKRRGRNPAG
jgi:hypothetical protein